MSFFLKILNQCHVLILQGCNYFPLLFVRIYVACIFCFVSGGGGIPSQRFFFSAQQLSKMSSELMVSCGNKPKILYINVFYLGKFSLCFFCFFGSALSWWWAEKKRCPNPQPPDILKNSLKVPAAFRQHLVISHPKRTQIQKLREKGFHTFWQTQNGRQVPNQFKKYRKTRLESQSTKTP